MTLLLLDLLTLASGPLLFRLVAGRPAAHAFVHDAARVLIGGVVLLHVLPEAWSSAGWLALPAMIVGALVVSLLERTHQRRATAWATTWLPVLALLAHHLLDGLTLAIPQQGWMGPGAAVVLHALPISLVAWGSARAAAGPRAGLLVLASIGLATVGGYALGRLAFEPGPGMTLLSCGLSGALLHALAHRPADHEEGDERVRTGSGLGAITALVALGFTLLIPDNPHHHFDLRPLLHLVLDVAPSLLLGFGAAGLLHAFAPSDVLARFAGHTPLRQATSGALVGLPMPVCSCGVLPVYEGFLRRGVPRPAALSFLIAGPELGIPTILLSFSLLGAGLGAVRIAASLAVAIAVAWWLGGGDAQPTAAPATPAGTPVDRLREAWRFGFVETVDHTLPWIFVGLVIAAALDPVLSDGALSAIPPWLSVPAFAAIGMPAYICAAGSTPLAAVMAHKGVSAGALVALMLTGPATNVTTFGVLARLHGRGFAVRFGLTMLVSTVAAGWLIDLLPWQPTLPAPSALADAALHPVAVVSALGMGALTVAALLRQGTDGFLGAILSPLGHEHHEHHEHGDHCDCGHPPPSGLPLDQPLTNLRPVDGMRLGRR